MNEDDLALMDLALMLEASGSYPLAPTQIRSYVAAQKQLKRRLEKSQARVVDLNQTLNRLRTHLGYCTALLEATL